MKEARVWNATIGDPLQITDLPMQASGQLCGSGFCFRKHRDLAQTLEPYLTPKPLEYSKELIFVMPGK